MPGVVPQTSWSPVVGAFSLGISTRQGRQLLSGLTTRQHEMTRAAPQNGRFVVVTNNRSGSTWVMSILNGLSGVAAHGELFLRRARSSDRRWDSEFARPRFVEERYGRLRVRPFSVFGYLGRLFEAPGTTGFKLMYRQLAQYPEILLFVLVHRTPVIHLIRRNHLDVVISYAVKASLGRAHLLADQAEPETVQVTLDEASLVNHLRRLRRHQRIGRFLLKVLRIRHVELVYETLLDDPATFRDAFDLLSVSASDLPGSNIVKITRAGHRDVIRNYEAVKVALCDTEFADLLR